MVALSPTVAVYAMLVIFMAGAWGVGMVASKRLPVLAVLLAIVLAVAQGVLGTTIFRPTTLISILAGDVIIGIVFFCLFMLGKDMGTPDD